MWNDWWDSLCFSWAYISILANKLTCQSSGTTYVACKWYGFKSLCRPPKPRWEFGWHGVIFKHQAFTSSELQISLWLKCRSGKLRTFLYMNESSEFPLKLTFWFFSLKFSNRHLPPYSQIFSLDKSWHMPISTCVVCVRIEWQNTFTLATLLRNHFPTVWECFSLLCQNV